MSTDVASGVSTITPQELQKLRESGQPIELVDVRTPAEFREVHADLARLAPLDQLDPRAIMESRSRSQDAPLYLICRTGSRAKKAAEKFLAAGYTQIVLVEGGTLAWEQAGLPVIRGKKTISLERQVRIAAGLLVFAGTLLGAFVHPSFLIIPGFVGAGLTFAGITDTCGMGMLLAKAPWNRVPVESASCKS